VLAEVGLMRLVLRGRCRHGRASYPGLIGL